METKSWPDCGVADYEGSLPSNGQEKSSCSGRGRRVQIDCSAYCVYAVISEPDTKTRPRKSACLFFFPPDTSVCAKNKDRCGHILREFD